MDKIDTNTSGAEQMGEVVHRLRTGLESLQMVQRLDSLDDVIESCVESAQDLISVSEWCIYWIDKATQTAMEAIERDRLNALQHCDSL